MGYFNKTFGSFSGTCESVIEKPHIRVFPVSEVGSRFYSTKLSRWVNRDPIGEAGHELVVCMNQRCNDFMFNFIRMRIFAELLNLATLMQAKGFTEHAIYISTVVMQNKTDQLFDLLRFLKRISVSNNNRADDELINWMQSVSIHESENAKRQLMAVIAKVQEYLFVQNRPIMEIDVLGEGPRWDMVLEWLENMCQTICPGGTMATVASGTPDLCKIAEWQKRRDAFVGDPANAPWDDSAPPPVSTNPPPQAVPTPPK